MKERERKPRKETDFEEGAAKKRFPHSYPLRSEGVGDVDGAHQDAEIQAAADKKLYLGESR